MDPTKPEGVVPPGLRPSHPDEGLAREGLAFLFDLDGTLVDSVYQHVLAWREALEQAGIELAVWLIHRRIGMSGGLFLDALGRETGRRLTPEDVTSIQQAHATAFRRQVSTVRPLPGAVELLAYLSRSRVHWAIATSGRLESARPLLEMLGVEIGRASCREKGERGGVGGCVRRKRATSE